MERERDADDDRMPDDDQLVDSERESGNAEDYKPLIDPEDERSDYEARTHGQNRQI
jgi:hypothetical protein